MKHKFDKMTEEELYSLREEVSREIDARYEDQKEKLIRKNLKYIGKTYVERGHRHDKTYLIITGTCWQSDSCMMVRYFNVHTGEGPYGQPFVSLTTGTRIEQIFKDDGKKKRVSWELREISNEEFQDRLREAMEITRSQFTVEPGPEEAA